MTGAFWRAVFNLVVPYLFMSPEMRSAVTENMPVTLHSQVELCIWNTTDAQNEKVIESPAYLAIVFQTKGSGSLTIRVPFQPLGFTLEPPIASTTQQYFECRPFHAADNSGEYFLGKAFLQTAFLGMNWQAEIFFWHRLWARELHHLTSEILTRTTPRSVLIVSRVLRRSGKETGQHFQILASGTSCISY